MSDKKAPASATPDDKKTNNQKDVPTVTDKAEPKSNFAKAAEGRDTNGKKGDKAAVKTGGSKTGANTKAPTKPRAAKKGSGWTWFWLLLLALIALAVAAWYFIPSVRTQANSHLQNLPLVGRHFAADTQTISQSGRTTATRDNVSTAGGQSKGADSVSSTPSATGNNNATDAGSTNNQSAAADSAQPPVPEQPILQPSESQPTPPTATSPTPPVNQNLELIKGLRQQLEQQNQVIEQLQQQLAGVQRNVTAQGNRLSQLGNASREDWQLAEADYLLRLANQRLMLEQDSRSALGLLQEVDKIIRDVDMPDLYGVRQQLSRDITALKLVENVDREGLYLRLRALEEQMVKLNIQPQFDLAKRDAAAIQQQNDNPEIGEAHFRSSWDNFLNFLKGSVRIRDGEVDPVLLSPQSETRFRQSLRLNMEQAELAVLRADDTVFKDSMNHARQLLLDYGVDNPQRQVILRELEELAQEKVKVELPNLSASQTALRNYIDKMHKVSSGQTPDNDNGGSDW
ncbi:MULTISPECIES: uroporphyrinogen-III C-methyltransferase [Microbulbifer]|uniref:uroporphyrinogen-III C-methyltransferase n=1 Tax=Microbulbifer TaxID=48073 RepID=UPI001CD3E25A|nr:uroporphyrinogen-III C-methyltransferase [Microbulbifer agarilyticus]MCA0899831.1 uroporphyrinogen-III C-methyltransferase [Microbulbifer agarilyticus]